MVSTPSPKTDDPVRTARETAGQLGISVQTLYNWNNLGKGPEYIKYGDGSGRIRYKQSVIDAFKAGRQVAAA